MPLKTSPPPKSAKRTEQRGGVLTGYTYIQSTDNELEVSDDEWFFYPTFIRLFDFSDVENENINKNRVYEAKLDTLKHSIHHIMNAVQKKYGFLRKGVRFDKHLIVSMRNNSTLGVGFMEVKKDKVEVEIENEIEIENEDMYTSRFTWFDENFFSPTLLHLHSFMRAYSNQNADLTDPMTILRQSYRDWINSVKNIVRSESDAIHVNIKTHLMTFVRQILKIREAIKRGETNFYNNEFSNNGFKIGFNKLIIGLQKFAEKERAFSRNDGSHRVGFVDGILSALSPKTRLRGKSNERFRSTVTSGSPPAHRSRM